MYFFQLIKDHPIAVKRSIALISCLLYFASIITVPLIFNKYCGQNPNPVAKEFWHGLDILLWGFIGLMSRLKPAIGWLGNPVGAIALFTYLRKHYKSALVWSLISLSLSLLGIHRLWGRKIIADEGGFCHLVLSELGIGCWLWLGAQIVIGIGSIMMLVVTKGLIKKSAVQTYDRQL